MDNEWNIYRGKNKRFAGNKTQESQKVEFPSWMARNRSHSTKTMANNYNIDIMWERGELFSGKWIYVKTVWIKRTGSYCNEDAQQHTDDIV